MIAEFYSFNFFGMLHRLQKTEKSVFFLLISVFRNSVIFVNIITVFINICCHSKDGSF